MFAACQFDSGWKYLTDPDNTRICGNDQSVWTLTNLYTDNIERRLDEIRGCGLQLGLGELSAWIFIQGRESTACSGAKANSTGACARNQSHGVLLVDEHLFTTSAYIGNPESKTWVQEQMDGKPWLIRGFPSG